MTTIDWANRAIEQQLIRDAGETRKQYLLQRLGQFFLAAATDDSLSAAESLNCLEAATVFAKSVAKVINGDKTADNVQALAWIDEAVRAGVSPEYADFQFKQVNAAEEANQNPVIRKLIRDATAAVVEENT